MYGSGPNVVWSMFVNVSAYPVERVREILQTHFDQLKYSISAGAERWPTMSTDDQPDEYDETDVEASIIALIERLTGADEGDLRPAG